MYVHTASFSYVDLVRAGVGVVALLWRRISVNKPNALAPIKVKTQGNETTSRSGLTMCTSCEIDVTNLGDGGWFISVGNLERINNYFVGRIKRYCWILWAAWRGSLLVEKLNVSLAYKSHWKIYCETLDERSLFWWILIVICIISILFDFSTLSFWFRRVTFEDSFRECAYMLTVSFTFANWFVPHARKFLSQTMKKQREMLLAFFRIQVTRVISKTLYHYFQEALD